MVDCQDRSTPPFEVVPYFTVQPSAFAVFDESSLGLFGGKLFRPPPGRHFLTLQEIESLCVHPFDGQSRLTPRYRCGALLLD